MKELKYKTGERRVFVKTAADTDGTLLEMDATYLPNSERPPMHFHPHQEEHFEIQAGRFRVWLGGEETVYGPGETFHIPKAAPHWMQNISEQEGRVNWQVRPALRTQDFFTAMWRVNENSGSDRPGLLQMADILREYRPEFIVSNPPLIVQRMLFGILAPIGRLLGYKAEQFAADDG